jgi:hypothetical protein
LAEAYAWHMRAPGIATTIACPLLTARRQDPGLLFGLLTYAATDLGSGCVQGIPGRRLEEVDDRQMQWVSDAGLAPLPYRASGEGILEPVVLMLVLRPAPRVRPEVLLGFAMLWDAPWTDDEREPVFGDSGAIAAGAVDAATPLPTLEDAVDNHAENAQRCSENRRQLVGLIDLIRKLQAQKRER